jgi:plastocyanin
MTKRIVSAATVAAIVLIAVASAMVVSPNAAQANAEQPPAATADVKIDNFSFGPQTLKVAIGTTVTWTNRDDIPHTVVSTDGSFKSKVRDTDETFSYKFEKAGTYPYFCSLHPKMTGQIVVH